jgi:hypothetical protein
MRVTILLQRLNIIEQVLDYFKARDAPQTSNSGSNNHNSMINQYDNEMN